MQGINMSSCRVLASGQYNEGLMDAFAAEAAPRIHEFSQQNLSNLSWCATLCMGAGEAMYRPANEEPILQTDGKVFQRQRAVGVP